MCMCVFVCVCHRNSKTTLHHHLKAPYVVLNVDNPGVKACTCMSLYSARVSYSYMLLLSNLQQIHAFFTLIFHLRMLHGVFIKAPATSLPSSSEYLAAMELEMWKLSQEETFANKMKAKEAEYLHRLGEEWKKREEERQKVFTQKVIVMMDTCTYIRTYICTCTCTCVCVCTK